MYSTFGFEKIVVKLSTRPEKRIGSDEMWDRAEADLAVALEENNIPFEYQLGEGAFYGPKIEFTLYDCLDRAWQCGTVQLDFSLPSRLSASYVGEDNERKVPVMIHRAPFGSMERFVAVLIEHTAGKFPLWLTPEQVVILPIADKFNDYAEQVKAELRKYDIRAIVDGRNEKIGRKIRDNEMKRIPYLLIVGEKEAANGEVSVRRQGEGDKGTMKIEEFGKNIAEEVSNMINKW